MRIFICVSDPRCCDCSPATINSLPFGEAEIKRLLEIKNDAAKAQSLSTLLALNTLLTHRAIPPQSIRREENGKPVFVGNAPHFNLSHSSSLVAAVLADAPIGIDVEVIRDDIKAEAIVHRFFTEAEQAAWRHSPTNECFFALWTQKEARAKLWGDALLRSTHTENTFVRCFALSLPEGLIYLSVAATEPIEDVVWITNEPLSYEEKSLWTSEKNL